MNLDLADLVVNCQKCGINTACTVLIVEALSFMDGRIPEKHKYIASSIGVTNSIALGYAGADAITMKRINVRATDDAIEIIFYRYKMVIISVRLSDDIETKLGKFMDDLSYPEIT